MLSATKTALVFTGAAMLIGCGQVPEKKSEDKLDDEEKKQVEEALSSLEEAIKSEDAETIEASIKN